MKCPQGLQHQLMLELGPVGFARCMAQREIQERGPRRKDGSCNRKGACHADGRNPRRFEFSGYQSDRLMAYGSDGDEQRKVCSLVPHFIQNFRSEFFANLAGRINPAHEGKGLGGERS